MRDPTRKQATLAAAGQWRDDCRAQGRRVVLTNGCFDLLHRGHVEYLVQARNLGDALIVAVNTDVSIAAIKGPGRPVISEADRTFLLASLEAVDLVVPFGTPDDTTVCPLLRRLLPDLYVKGGGYTPETINRQEHALLQELHIGLALLPLVPGISTTELLQRIRRANGE